jgi:O-antigen/teichoic acid export membrane protein
LASESTFRPALLLMVGRAFASAATLLIPVTLVRVFDQTEYGTYKQLFLVFATLYSVALVGLSDSLYYFLPKDPSRGGRYAANAVFGLLLAGLVCLAGLQAARHLVAGWLRNPLLSEQLGPIGVLLLFALPATVLETALVARKRYAWASSAYVASDLARAAFFVLPMLVWTGLRTLLLGAIAFSVLRMLAALFLLKREFGPEFRMDTSLWPAQLAYALPFALYVLVEMLQSTFHQYAVSWHFDAATFAIYAVGCFQVPFVDFLATPASSVMMVRMGEELQAGRPADALAIWLDVTRKLALVFFPMAALLMASSREVIAVLFTDRYAASAPIFALWVTSMAFAAVQTDGVLRVHAQVRFLFLVNVVRLVLIVALIQPLMSAFGLLGPVLVTLLAMAVAKALHLLRLKRILQLDTGAVLPWGSLGGILGVSAAAALAALAVRALLAGPPLLVLLAEGAAYSVVYLALLLAAGLVRPEERVALGRWLRIPSPRPLAASGVE